MDEIAKIARKAKGSLYYHFASKEELFKEVKWNEYFNYDWQEVYYLIKKMKITDDYKINFSNVNFEKIEKISTLITELALRISNLDHRLIVDKLEMEAVQ